MNISRVQSGS